MRTCPRCGTPYSAPYATCRPCHYHKHTSSVSGSMHRDLERTGVRRCRGKRFIGEHQGYLALAQVIVTGIARVGMDPRGFFSAEELDLVRDAAEAMCKTREEYVR